jgi:hypothetical protein
MIATHAYFRSLNWPLLSTTNDTSLPSFVALTAMPSAVDLKDDGYDQAPEDSMRD